MSVLLVITTGQTDVQLAKGGKRFEFAKNSCAKLHDELERRADEWQVVDAPVEKSAEWIDSLPDSSFEICAPKLDALCRYLIANSIVPTQALVLDTRRDPDKFPGDPRYAGTIIKRELLKRFQGIEVHQALYLKENERLEDASTSRDAVIRQDVVRRIEEAIVDCTSSGHGRIIVCATGGMPGIASFVEEAVQLHGIRSRVELLEIADGSRATPPKEDKAVPRREQPEPTESFRARRHALTLIGAGSLLAAWGAVQHLDHDLEEKKWTRVVDWLARFAASLPMPDECDIDVLKHPGMAVRVALRVEFALRAGDIPRAVHGTVAFFEAALWDHLLECLERHPGRNKRRYFKFKSGKAPCDKLFHQGDGAVERSHVSACKTCKKLIRQDDVSDEDRKRPFRFKEAENGVAWFWINDDDVCAVRLAKYYLKLDGLTKLGKAISGVRDLRNDVAHNEPTPRLMREARSKMIEKKLWSEDSRFLSVSLVQDTLKELGIETPENLCDHVLDEVRERLLEPR